MAFPPRSKSHHRHDRYDQSLLGGQNPACSPTTYHAGEGFVDYGDHAHLLRNKFRRACRDGRGSISASGCVSAN